MAEPFDAARPKLVTLSAAINRIGDAWLAQYRGAGFVSSLIKRATGGPHSHSAMLRRNLAGGVDVLELREFCGGRVRPLDQHVAQYPGRIDCFAPNAGNRWSWPDKPDCEPFSARGAVAYMELLTRLDYGYRSVLRIALRKLPLAWRFYALTTDDVLNSGRNVRPFCSHAVALAYRKGGFVDCVPRQPDYLTTPADLTRSMFFSYQFTLTP